MFGQIYNSILFLPLLNLLVWLYGLLWNDLGLAIIALTIIVRLILYPSFKHQLESQKKLAEIQPKLQELKDKHKDSKDAQNQALMQFYKENKVNPLSSCLPLIVQIFILYAMYHVFMTGLNGEVLQYLYPFIKDPGKIHAISFNFLDVSKPNGYLAVITGIMQYLQAKKSITLQPPPNNSKDKNNLSANMSAVMSKQMLYFFPILTIYIGFQLPAGLTLYWLISTVFAIFQQYFIMKDKKPVPVK